MTLGHALLFGAGSVLALMILAILAHFDRLNGDDQ